MVFASYGDASFSGVVVVGDAFEVADDGATCAPVWSGHNFEDVFCGGVGVVEDVFGGL